MDSTQRCLALVAVVLWAFGGGVGRAATQPNILRIVADDVGAEASGLYQLTGGSGTHPGRTCEARAARGRRTRGGCAVGVRRRRRPCRNAARHPSDCGRRRRRRGVRPHQSRAAAELHPCRTSTRSQPEAWSSRTRLTQGSQSAPNHTPHTPGSRRSFAGAPQRTGAATFRNTNQFVARGDLEPSSRPEVPEEKDGLGAVRITSASAHEIAQLDRA